MKTTQRSNAWKMGGGIAGLALVGVIAVAFNVVLSTVRLRADLTEQKLYTLSDGTVSMLQKLEHPVTLKLFFSSSSAAVPAQLKAYARQVEDLLREYQSRAADMVTIEKHDPKPDSDAEEWAQRYGVAGQTTDMFGGPSVYFGLVATSGDAEAVIPAFDPSQEQLLEYTITRLIYRVTHPDKPVLGVISSLPVLGSQPPPYPMPGQKPQQQPAWVAFQNLRQDYDVRDLSTSVADIDPDIDALLVIHPKDLPEKTVFAIDQFVLRGGHLLLMLDPLSIADEGTPGANQFAPPQRASDVPQLLAAWGVGYEPDKVVADMDAATNIRGQNNSIERSMVALSLTTNNINRADTLTTQLDAMLLPFAGALADNTSADLEFTPLLTSSDDAGPVSTMMAQFGNQAVQREYKDSPVRLNLAVRLSGTFKTAFPNGRPPEANDDENAEAPAPGPVLTNGVSTVIVTADVDMIYDPICVEAINVFGYTAHRERNDNLSFFANAVEMTAGSQDLVAVRSRGNFYRPFDKVLDLQAQAMREWQGREAELEDKLRETERQLQDMQANKQADQSFILSREQQEAIQNFKKEELRVKRELKNVRKNLRKEIEQLGIVVKTVNIALMPLLVSIAGVTYGVLRRRRETR